MPELAKNIADNFSKKTVVIVGDLVADQYLNGTISRVSREAPVFILRHDETTTFPGAAGNAAANIASLGGSPLLIGVVGCDVNGGLLRQSIEAAKMETNYVVESPQFATTTKVRVLAGQIHAARQQVIRIDYENSARIPDEVRVKLRNNLEVACKMADAIIFSDYNYGVADSAIFELAREEAAQRNIPLLVDSRFRLSEFHGATAATPNQEEVEQILGVGFSDDDCTRLCGELGYESLLVTNGSKGMAIYRNGRQPVHISAVGSTAPVDVTGAGDTVIAAYALGLASGLDFVDAATVANHAGGLVVMKKGTATVSLDELIISVKANTKAFSSITN